MHPTDPSTSRPGRFDLPGLLALAVLLIGLGLRVEHALTFNGPVRGADYAVNLHGVRWMLEHHRPFDFTQEVSTQVRYQPPLWYALGALILGLTGHERPIAFLAVIGWLIRQLVLARLLREAIPRDRWSALVALSIHAFLPIGILTDGKLNPEGLHTTLFTVAVYGLWRIEREAQSAAGVSLKSALLFGGFSGLAVLTKATAGVLPLLGAIVFAWQAYCLRRSGGWQLVRDRLVRAGATAALMWCLVAGWWCGQNLVKYHHPFPHSWNMYTHLEEPVLYRRPLGWALPFEWREYLESPVIFTDREPRPNFWAACITGTWTDFYNRGFCRLKGGEVTTRAWGARWSGPYGGSDWNVTLRCIRVFIALLWVGLPITFGTVLSVYYVLSSQLRSRALRGSLVLPLTASLVVLFVLLFALVYPFDDNAVLNPRYLLPAATPMAACLAIAIAQVRVSRNVRLWLQGASLLAIGVVGALVIFERFG